nr:glycosyltransferase family 2 protein [Aquisalinus flavus]
MSEPYPSSQTVDRTAGGTATVPAVSVLIVSYNTGVQRLSRCLAALSSQSFSDFEIILLDNGSDDGSVAAQSLPDNAIVVEAGSNLGFAGGMNRAAQAATGTWLALLNPDTMVRPDWLGRLIEATQRHPGVKLFGSVQIDMADRDRLDGLGDVYHASGIAWRGGYGASTALIPMQDEEIFAPCAAACLYHADLFRNLGGFEESFFCYNEDVDFGFRARLMDERAVLVHDATILHEGSGITGRRSAFTVYHGTRNRIWTFIRCMPAPLIWLMFPVHVLANVFFLARAVPLGVAGAYWRGMIDGFFKAGDAWAARRDLQENRIMSWRAMAGMMTFSLGKLLTRAPDMRSLPADED